MDRAAHERLSEVLGLAKAAGFAIAAVTDARPSERGAEIRAWLAAGKHGTMEWLAKDLDIRLDPRRLLTGGKTVLCVADRYARPGADRREDVWPPRGRVARYARGYDYHVWMRKRLRTLSLRLRERFPGERFRHACDLLPILERELAGRAGIGAVAKNTLILRPGEGSYLVLGEILMTLDLPLSPAGPANVDPCGTCTRCIEACPTAAITPYSVDASRCLSYTTIEHRGVIDESLHAPTDDWFFGCDVCQEVCPHNQPTRARKRLPIDEQYLAKRPDVDLLEVLGWSEEDRLAATMRSALRRAYLPMMKRNALVILGNAWARRPSLASASPEAVEREGAVRTRIESIAADEAEAEVVRATARQVLASIERVTAAASPSCRPPRASGGISRG